MSPKNCKHDPLKLYSSDNFAPGSKSDSTEIKGCRLDNKLKLLIKFVSKYGNDYFKAIVSLDVYNDSGVLKKKNIVIDIILLKIVKVITKTLIY